MSIAFDYEAKDEFEGAAHFAGGDECSNQKHLGSHYHIEIERESSDKGVAYADVAVVLTVEQATQLRDDLSMFLLPSEAAKESRK